MRIKTVITIGLLLTPMAWSEESDNNQNIESIVVTASRDAQSLTSVTRSIAQLSSQDLELSNHAHVQEVFNQLPGVHFHRNSGQEYLAAIRSPVLTGAGACGEFLMLENGVPLRPAGMCNVNELFETHHQLADSIEFLRGPSTSVYGSNGLHGVVNISTPALPEGAGKTKITLGSNEYVKLNQLNHFGEWTSALTITRDGGFRDSSGFNQQVLTLKHLNEGKEFDVSSWLTMFNLDQQTAGYLVGEGAYKDKSLSKTNPNPEAYREGAGFRAYQTYEWQNGLTISPFLRHSKMEFIQHFLPGQPIEENGQTSAGVQTSKAIQLSETIDLNIGVDTEFASMHLLEFQDSPTDGSAFLQATIPAGKHYDYDVKNINLAAFVVSNIELNNALNVNVGFRAEFNEFDYDNNMLSGRTDEAGQACGFGGCRFSRPEDRKDDFFKVSPQLGVIYSLAQGSNVYASLSHGFRSPQATELYRLQREQTVADLKPVEIEGIDAGWRFNSPDLNFELALYHYDKSNAIIRNSDFFNISGGETRHRGLEVSFEYSLSANYSVAANSTFSKHTYLNNPGISSEYIVGLDVDTAPRELSNVFVKYRNENVRWQLHGQYVGDYFTDVENQHRYSGHLLFHFNANYDWSNSTQLGLKVTNLTDERYADRADYSGFVGDRYFPGRGTNIQLSIAVSY